MALEKYKRAVALFISYGQKNIREEASSIDTVKYYIERGYDVLRVEVDIGDIWKYSRSELISMPTSAWAPKQVEEFRGEAPSSVPFRNAVLISVATAHAIMANCDQVWIGATGQGANQYADCSSSFLGAMAEAVAAGTDSKVSLILPFWEMDKEAIVKRACLADVPLGLTWTCYDVGPVPCRKCLSCVERMEAFRKANLFDPAYAC